MQLNWRVAGLAIAASLASVGVATPSTPSMPSTPPRQKVWQADVRVQTLEVTTVKRGGPLSARVVIATDSDDDARAVRLEIMLPIGVGVLRVPAGCRPSASTVQSLNARVTCDLGDIPVRGLREVTISTTGAAAGSRARFAAFVSSDTPDPEPTNNYAERAVP